MGKCVCPRHGEQFLSFSCKEVANAIANRETLECFDVRSDSSEHNFLPRRAYLCRHCLKSACPDAKTNSFDVVIEESVFEPEDEPLRPSCFVCTMLYFDTDEYSEYFFSLDLCDLYITQLPHTFGKNLEWIAAAHLTDGTQYFGKFTTPENAVAYIERLNRSRSAYPDPMEPVTDLEHTIVLKNVSEDLIKTTVTELVANDEIRTIFELNPFMDKELRR